MSEVEVIELEKRFWSLVGNSSSGRIDISIITPLVSPPLPQALVPGLFKAFDENQVYIYFCYPRNMKFSFHHIFTSRLKTNLLSEMSRVQ